MILKQLRHEMILHWLRYSMNFIDQKKKSNWIKKSVNLNKKIKNKENISLKW